MALRDYMQDLLRSQTSGDDDYEENGTVKIIIVDDNSSSSLPEDLMEESENGSMNHTSFPRHTHGIVHSEGAECDHGYLRVDWVGEPPHDSREDTNRTMLDDFRRRQRYLRETLSPNPKRASVMATGSPIKFSPSPIITQWTPPTFHRDSEERIPRDSQRDRMRRLKASLRIQQNGSSLLI